MRQQREVVDTWEVEIEEQLGEYAFLKAIQLALDYETKEDIYKYIIRCYDLEVKENEEDE